MTARRSALACAAACLLALSGSARAQSLQWHGYLDLRVALRAPGEVSWTKGGLGKQRFGDGAPRAALAGVAAMHWDLSPAWSATADFQANSQASPSLGVLSASLRLRPVSTTPWRWSVQAGAFFPPVSLENAGIGWTSPWTLSPSAINSWVGEELRTLGVQGRLERRGVRGSLDVGLALFRANDPAGELLASRGWAIGDMSTTLGARLRQPDAYAPLIGTVAPLRFEPFAETDSRTGYHADAEWNAAGGARFRLLRYDNRADPETSRLQEGRRVYSWHTRFSSAGVAWPLGGASLVAQWMRGDTAIEPSPDFYLDSRFRAWFVLLGRDHGAWRPALRYDAFRVRRSPAFLADPLDEDGHAITAALNWHPAPSLRVTLEWLHVDSRRNQRRLEGQGARQRDDGLQLAVRLLY